MYSGGLAINCNLDEYNNLVIYQISLWHCSDRIDINLLLWNIFYSP